MNSNEILTAIIAAELTVGELNEIAEVATKEAAGAESRFAKLFELGDRVRNEDGRYGTVARRNVHTVSVLFDGDTETVKVTPSELVDIVDVMDDPENFDYFDYFGAAADEDEITA